MDRSRVMHEMRCRQIKLYCHRRRCIGMHVHDWMLLPAHRHQSGTTSHMVIDMHHVLCMHPAGYSVIFSSWQHLCSGEPLLQEHSPALLDGGRIPCPCAPRCAVAGPAAGACAGCALPSNLALRAAATPCTHMLLGPESGLSFSSLLQAASHAGMHRMPLVGRQACLEAPTAFAREASSAHSAQAAKLCPRCCPQAQSTHLVACGRSRTGAQCRPSWRLYSPAGIRCCLSASRRLLVASVTGRRSLHCVHASVRCRQIIRAASRRVASLLRHLSC